jgi:ATP-dependent DNA ligase
LARRSVHIGVSWVEPKAAPLALRVYGTRCKRSPKAVDLPRWIAPQLTQLSAAAPSGPQWVHEIKLDGFRMAARIERGRPQLLTRTGLDWTDKYPSVVAALANIRVKAAYLDGELCGVGDDGLPSFSQTQAASDGERGVRLVYYAFDLLHLDGRDTASLPLIERKALLEPLIAGTPGLQFNGHESGDGEIVRQHACKLGFEASCRRRSTRPMRQEIAACGGVQMPQPAGIRCRWLDGPRRVAALSRRAPAWLLH